MNILSWDPTIERNTIMRKIIFMFLLPFLFALTYQYIPVNARNNQIWEGTIHVFSDSATRWTKIILTDELHVFWAKSDSEDTRDPYKAEYFSIYHSSSTNGIDWQAPNDIIFDGFGITGLQVQQSDERIHLFWISDCIHHAFIYKDSIISDPTKWINTNSCISPKAIPESITTENIGNIIYLFFSIEDGFWFQVSEDDGETWTDPEIIVASNFLTENFSPILAFPSAAISANNNTIHFAWSVLTSDQEGNRPLGVFYSRLENRLANWTTPIELAGEGSTQPHIKIDGNDTLHAVWNTSVGISKRIYRNSSDMGNSWSNPTEIYSYDMENITAGIQGTPGLSILNDETVIFLVGTNAGVRLIERVNGELSIMESLESINDGETWVTGIIPIDESNYCVYWSAFEAPSPGFSIKCKEKFQLERTNNQEKEMENPAEMMDSNFQESDSADSPSGTSVIPESKDFPRFQGNRFLSSTPQILGISVGLSLIFVIAVIIFFVIKKK